MLIFLIAIWDEYEMNLYSCIAENEKLAKATVIATERKVGKKVMMNVLQEYTCSVRPHVEDCKWLENAGG
jgi:hypothetical protein